MFPTLNPTTTEAWKELESYFKTFKGTQMKDLFANDPKRFEKYSVKFEDILVDFSKNIVDDHIFSLFMQVRHFSSFRRGAHDSPEFFLTD